MVVDQAQGLKHLHDHFVRDTSGFCSLQEELHAVAVDFLALSEALGSKLGLSSDGLLVHFDFVQWVGRHFDEADALGVPVDQQLFEELHDCFALNVEGVSLSNDLLVERVKSNDELTDEATKGVDTGGQVSLEVSDIVNGDVDAVLLLLAAWHHGNHEHFLQLLDALLLLKAHATLSSAILGLCSLFFFAALLILKVFTALHLSFDGSLVLKGAANESSAESLLDGGTPVLVLDHLQLQLVVEGRHEVGTHRVLLLLAEKTHVFQGVKSVTLEELEELFRDSLSDCSLRLTVLKHLVDSLLQVASIGFVVAARLTGFDALSLHEHGLTSALVSLVVLGEHSIFVGLNHLDASLLKRLADEDL